MPIHSTTLGDYFLSYKYKKSIEIITAYLFKALEKPAANKQNLIPHARV